MTVKEEGRLWEPNGLTDTVMQKIVIKTVRKLLATDYDSDLEGIQPFPAYMNFKECKYILNCVTLIL
jgi:hypothetical protein